MNPSLKAVRRGLETCEIAHAAYAGHLSALRRRIDDTLDGGAAAVDAVYGPSRVGKTMLINALKLAYPETHVDGCRRIPLLAFTLPTPVTPKEMPRAVLEALGAPSAMRSGGTASLFERMKLQLKLAGTRVLLVEEASHTVDKGARVQAREAADWFKQVTDLNLTLILFGLPKLRTLFESNEQLRLRANKPREFRPYDCRDGEQMKQYAACVKTFATMFKQAGWPIELPLEVLAGHCYLLSGGLIGVTSTYMQRLAWEFESEAPRPLTFADCAKALAGFEPAGSPRFPAFGQDTVSPPELAAAHAHVLDTSGLTLGVGGAP